VSKYFDGVATRMNVELQVHPLGPDFNIVGDLGLGMIRFLCVIVVSLCLTDLCFGMSLGR
jgi:hypothetical protein